MQNYIKIPNIPKHSVSLVIVDNRINEKSEKALKKRDIRVIKTARVNSLYDAVSSHPDMQIHHLGDNVLVCEKSLCDYYKKQIPSAEIIPGSSALTEKYPNDIAFNCARVGDFLFHKLSFTDSEILAYYKRNGVKLINVKQGYSKCSIGIINERAVITSDRGINAEAIKNGIDSVAIRNDEIILKGLNCGFFGGICGLIDEKTLCVNGNIEKLHDYRVIYDFCEKYNVKIINLNDSFPEDIGSILPICEES